MFFLQISGGLLSTDSFIADTEFAVSVFAAFTAAVEVGKFP